MTAFEDPSSLNECIEAVTIEDEDDYTGYFLEPTANTINIVERIAEANRQLYEEDNAGQSDPHRPRKVQFSESVINFEPEDYDSDELIESDDASTNSEEDHIKEDGKDVEKEPERSQRPKTAVKNQNWDIKKEPEEVVEEVQEEPRGDEEEDPQQVKVLLVMLPREQSSSCESVIGEEIPEEKPTESKTDMESEEENVTENPKPSKVPSVHPNLCKLSRVMPDLNYSPKRDSRFIQRKQVLRCKKANVGNDKESTRSKSSGDTKRDMKEVNGERHKTAPDRKSCCVPRTRLPKYNGFRSEYGLSAEQLQERKSKTFELRQQRRMDRLKKRQEEMQKRIQTEENFSRWLCSKIRGKSVRKPTQVDTLSRSDVYIQNHAVYASRRGISYSVEYGLRRKKFTKPSKMVLFDRKNEIINLDRLFDNVSSHVKHSYRIFLGSGQK